MQFRRNQDFYVSSNIELNCNGSLSMISKWTIYNCTSICSYEIVLDPTVIETTFSEFYMPSRTLAYGIYELKLTVTMVNFPSFSSSSVYVQITPAGITANLVQLGTSMITSGNQQDLKLDPGTFSVDLSGYTFNASVSDNHINCFSSLFDFFSHRIGNMNIIAEFMVHICFQICKALC